VLAATRGFPEILFLLHVLFLLLSLNRRLVNAAPSFKYEIKAVLVCNFFNLADWSTIASYKAKRITHVNKTMLPENIFPGNTNKKELNTSSQLSNLEEVYGEVCHNESGAQTVLHPDYQ